MQEFNFCEHASFVKIKPSRIGDISLSFTDIGISCPVREFFMSQMCLLALFAKTKFLRLFPNLQYWHQLLICVLLSYYQIFFYFFVLKITTLVCSIIHLRLKLKFYLFPLTLPTLKKSPYQKKLITIFSQEFHCKLKELSNVNSFIFKIHS